MSNTHSTPPQSPGLDNAALIDSLKQATAALINVNAANDALKQENKDLSERVEALEQAVGLEAWATKPTVYKPGVAKV